MGSELVRKNRFNILAYLRSIAEQNQTHLQESCVLAFGQVGRYGSLLAICVAFIDRVRTLKDDEFNLVLVSLVEYLGHSNPIVSGSAFNEVKPPFDNLRHCLHWVDSETCELE